MILAFDRVSKSYGPVRALNDFSFALERGEIVAVLGPNGAGKTTALEIALGLRMPTSGSVRIFDQSPRRGAARARLGATPQESGFPDALRVREILAFVATHYASPSGLEQTLAVFGLSELADRRADTLSGGESRRLALAIAFVGNPELIVLDEPTTGLDAQSRRRLWQVVRAATQGRSVLLSTHYFEEAEALATRIVVLDRGRLLFDGDPQRLRARFGVRRLVYEGEPLDPARAGVEATLERRDGRTVVTTADADAYVRALVASGTHFSDLEIARPSLEEAFLAITGEPQ
jgi:ABC-2 type transport system ATP-binding protein